VVQLQCPSLLSIVVEAEMMSAGDGLFACRGLTAICTLAYILSPAQPKKDSPSNQRAIGNAGCLRYPILFLLHIKYGDLNKVEIVYYWIP